MNLEISCLLALVSELQRNTLVTRFNDKEKKILQSTVAILFRISPKIMTSKLVRPTEIKKIHNLQHPNPEQLLEFFQANQTNFKFGQENILEILFLQRQHNKKDRHSGQIALPGGHLDNQESDIEALLREVFEESGIELKNSEDVFYLGNVPRNFFLYQKKDANLYLSAHAFLLIDSEDIKVNIDLKEIRDYKWVPFNIFIKETNKNRFLYKNISNLPPSNNKFMNSKYVKQNFLWVKYPGFDIEMQETLWGFTFLLFKYLLSMILASKTISVKTHNLSFVKKFVKHALSSSIVLKSEAAFSVPVNILGKRWILNNRLKQFRYSYESEKPKFGGLTTQYKSSNKLLYKFVAVLILSSIIIKPML